MNSTPRDHERIPAFDIARTLACFLVVATHIRVNQFLPYNDVESEFGNSIKFAFFQSTRLGLEAVLVFFCLSGYLIVASVHKSLISNTFSFSKYAVNRLSRIYTPYIPTILTSVLLASALGESIDVPNCLMNACCLQGITTPPLELNSSLWSVSYEVWFYLVWGFAAALIASRSLKYFLLTALALLAFAFLKPSYLFCWIIGGLSFFVPTRNRFVMLSTAILLLSLGSFVTQVTSKSNQVDLAYFSFLRPDLGVILFGTGCSCLLVAARNAFPSQTPLTSAARFFADFSYSTYLFHIPCIIILKKLTLLTPQGSLSLWTLALFVVNITCVYFFSYAMYLLFERHTKRVKTTVEAILRCGSSDPTRSPTVAVQPNLTATSAEGGNANS